MRIITKAGFVYEILENGINHYILYAIKNLPQSSRHVKSETLDEVIGPVF